MGAVRWSIDTADGDGLLVGSDIAPCKFKGIIGCIEKDVVSEGTGYIKEGAPSWFVWSVRSVRRIAGDAV